MIGTMVLCHATSWHGSKTMTTTMTIYTSTYNDVKTRQRDLPAKSTSFSLSRLSTTRVRGTHLFVCNLDPGLYIRAIRPPFQGNGWTDSRDFYSGICSSHTSYLFSHPIVTHQSTCTEEHELGTISETGHRALA